MRISFDLDDTLRLHGSVAVPEFQAVPWWLRPWFRERLRQGSGNLLNALEERGCDVGIYTTSSRSEMYIRRWFGCYGIRLGFVINEQVHSKVVGPVFQNRRCPSKHPGMFQIDLHIDDAVGVAMEGERHGFKTLIIDPEDKQWVDKVWQAVKDVESAGEN